MLWQQSGVVAMWFPQGICGVFNTGGREVKLAAWLMVIYSSQGHQGRVQQLLIRESNYLEPQHLSFKKKNIKKGVYNKGLLLRVI